MKPHSTFTQDSVVRGSIFLMVATLLLGWLAFTAFTPNESALLKNAVRLTAAFFGLIALFLMKKVKPILWPITSITLVLAVSTLNGNLMALNIVFLIYYAYVLSSFKKDISGIIFGVTLLGCLFHAYLVLFNKIDLAPVVIGDRPRFSLGFANPNNLSALYVSLIFSSIYKYLNTPSRNWKLIAFACICASLVPIYLSDSRTAAISCTVLFVWLFASKYRFIVRHNGVIAIFVLWTSVAITFFFATSSNYELDKLLSNRPTLFALFMAKTDFLTSMIGWKSEENITVDNLYLLMLSCCGLIISALILLATTYKTYSAERKFIPLIGALYAASITESILLRPELPAAAIFISVVFAQIKLKNTV